MKTEKISEQFVQNLLLVMPNWHAKLIDKLSEYQFVERVSNERDRRSVRIQLTPKASAYLDEYYLKNRVFIQMLEEQLTEEELQRLNEAARVLNEILPKLK